METGCQAAVRSITSRFVLLIASAAIAPLLIYGYVSVDSLRTGVAQSAQAGNAAVARQISERIAQYFDNNQRVLRSIAAQLHGTELEAWQQQRILRNHSLDFQEFREITLFDAAGTVIATSRAAKPSLTHSFRRAGRRGTASTSRVRPSIKTICRRRPWRSGWSGTEARLDRG